VGGESGICFTQRRRQLPVGRPPEGANEGRERPARRTRPGASTDRWTFRLFLSKGGNAILYFLGLAYFSRHLTPDEMGAFVLFLAVLGISSIPADFGIKGALEKRLSEGTDPEKTLGSALAFKAVTLAVVAVYLTSVE